MATSTPISRAGRRSRADRSLLGRPVQGVRGTLERFFDTDDLGRTREFAVDVRAATEFHHVTFVRDDLRLHVESIARHDRPFESHVIHSAEVIDGAIGWRTLLRLNASMPDSCAIASTINTPGIIGLPGKMAVEERLVDRHVLVTLDQFAGLDRHHPIDQQKRISMRQILS